MKLTRSLIATGLLAITASAAFAQVTQDDVWLKAPYATWRTSGVVAPVGGRNVYVGPYQAMFKSVGGFSSSSPRFDIYCVDFQHSISVGQQWRANFTSLAGSDMSKTRWQNQLKYQRAAYLSNKFIATTTTKWGSLHNAIWYVMTGTTPALGSDDAVGFYNDAVANGGSFDASSWVVITDVNVNGSTTPGTGGTQEFIYNTPEPATIILLGTGLLTTLALSGLIRKPMA